MAKLPAIQFYPGDWYRDSVSGCSLGAQGLWLRMLFIAHDSDRYGYLSQNGAAIPSDSIARRCGTTPEQYATLLCELDGAGVTSRTADGTIFSRRMVRDAQTRKATANRVADLRQKTKLSNARVTHDVTVKYEDEVEDEVVLNKELDGSAEFEKSCLLYPKPERGIGTQNVYMEAIGSIRRKLDSQGLTLTEKQAIDWLNGRIRMYAKVKFPVGFRKFLEERIFEQPDSAWIDPRDKQPAEASVGQPKPFVAALPECWACEMQFTGPIVKGATKHGPGLFCSDYCLDTFQERYPA